MTLELHNTLGGRREAFRPLTAGEAAFYSCGPTVYDFAHIGNFRAFLVADTLTRWLESPLCERVNPDGSPDGTGGRGGYRVTQVMNITDVGHMTDDSAADGAGMDKMEAAAARLREAKKAGKLPPGVDIDPGDPRAIAGFYAAAFVEDARTLGLRVVEESGRDATLLPRASEHVKGMLEIVGALLAKGCAYEAGDAVYFDTQRFPEYGALSGNTPERLRAGAGGRVAEADQARKKHPADFMLWKHDPKHLLRWDPSKVLGRRVALREGYPGWHVECSAMALERLAPAGSAHAGVIDLHSGGEDNIFPHHECEIAQSRCYTGKPAFARYWVHTRHLMVEGAKMSKSAGNFFTVRQVLAKGFEPGALRLELIKTHYRQNANFTEQGLKDAGRMAMRWRKFVEAGGASGERGARNEGAAAAFAAAMNDDLNTAGAIGAVNAWINAAAAPTRADAALLREMDHALGVLGLGAPRAGAGVAGGGDDGLAARVDALLERRRAARAAKDWKAADAVREELGALGVEIKDGPTGTTWTRRASL